MLTGASIFNDGHKNQELDATILARFIRVSLLITMSFTPRASVRAPRRGACAARPPYEPKSGKYSSLFPVSHGGMSLPARISLASSDHVLLTNYLGEISQT